MYVFQVWHSFGLKNQSLIIVGCGDQLRQCHQLQRLVLPVAPQCCLSLSSVVGQSLHISMLLVVIGDAERLVLSRTGALLSLARRSQLRLAATRSGSAR